MRELDACLRDLVAQIRATYQPTLAHDALVRAAIGELTALDEPEVKSAPARPHTPSLVTQVRTIAKCAADPVVSAATESALLQILASPARPGETIAQAFERRESELRAVVRSLRPLESFALHKRLADPRDGDELATQFSRLAPDRRSRLLMYIADARRREATRGRGAR